MRQNTRRLIWQNETDRSIAQYPSDTFAQARSCNSAPCGNMKIMKLMMMMRQVSQGASEREGERERGNQIYGLDSLLKCHRALMHWNETKNSPAWPPFIWANAQRRRTSETHFDLLYLIFQIFNIFMTHISAALSFSFSVACSLSEWLVFLARYLGDLCVSSIM